LTAVSIPQDHAAPRRTAALSLVQGRTGRQAPEPQLITISFDVRPEHAPALRSAIDDFTTILGTRMESRYDYEVEDALVRASIAVAQLRAAVFAAVPKGEPKFPIRKGRT
jgi:hypothetical protein